jgi:hypothetical protein
MVGLMGGMTLGVTERRIPPHQSSSATVEATYEATVGAHRLMLFHPISLVMLITSTALPNWSRATRLDIPLVPFRGVAVVSLFLS